MKIVWSPQAREDLLSLLAYIAEDNPAAARKVKDIIMSKIETLAETPSIGRPGRVPGTREMLIDSTPYIVPYRCVQERLEIVRVYHSSQKWPVKFE